MLNKPWLKGRLAFIGNKTQRELAKHMGLGEREATISEMIRGKRKPTLDQAILMADFLQCSFEEVLNKGFNIPESSIRRDYNESNNTINIGLLQDATMIASEFAGTHNLSKDDVRRIGRKAAEIAAFCKYNRVTEGLLSYIIEHEQG